MSGARRHGYIEAIIPHKRCAFIRLPYEPDVYFHQSEWRGDLEFSDQLRELRVEFTPIGTGKGWKATNVQPAP